jgi:flagellar basal body-associated protein FliL
MTTESKETKPAEGAAESAPAVPMKPSPIAGLLRILFPAILAAGAAYGGTRVAAARTPPAAGAGGHGEAHHAVEVHPPGPTLPLDPFLVTIFDANKKAHPMKMSLAVEFDSHTKEDLKTFIPRVRDAILAHLRTLSHEQVTDPGHVEKMRAELLEKCKAAGATGAERVLVTDFVVQ